MGVTVNPGLARTANAESTRGESQIVPIPDRSVNQGLFATVGAMLWPAERPCPFDKTTPSLQSAWQRSAKLIASLRAMLTDIGIPDRVRTVYVSGSLGRMEAVETSDCDAVVVLSDDDRLDASEVMETVFDCVEAVGFQRPKVGGIFGSPTSFEQLLDPTTAGKVNEDQSVFGKRIQALLDSQPLIHADEFGSLQDAILTRYASAPQADPSAFKLGWLIDDVIRYWRSLSVRTRWFCHDDTIAWRAVNVKLRHSRMLLCAGLFRVLQACATSGTSEAELLQHLRLVPAERFAPSPLFLADGLPRYDVFMNAMQTGLKDIVRDQARFEQLIDNGARLSKIVGQCLQDEFGNQMATGLFGELP